MVSCLPLPGRELLFLVPDLGAEYDAKHLVARPLPTGSGWAQPEKANWDPPTVSSPPAGGVKGVGVLGGVWSGRWSPDLNLNSVLLLDF